MSVTIPDSVTSIGSSAFYNCSGLKSVHVTDLAKWCGISFGNSSANPLYYARNLYLNGVKVTSLTIPNSVTSIGEEAFSGCSGLTSVTIPNSVTSIGEEAFFGCSGLTSVTIPDSVTSIGGWAFYGCSKLTSVHITDLAKWCGISFGNSSANPLYYAHNLYLNGVKVTSLTIPDSVTSIGEYAFSGCSGLTSVTIPDSVTSIGSSAFSGCSGLTSVTIPRCICSSRLSSVFPQAYQSITNVVICDSVTSIGDNAFSGCSGLTSVTIPDSVTSIGAYAFDGCGAMVSLTVPESLVSVGYYAFRGCKALPNGEDGYKIAGGWLLGCSDGASDTISDVDELRGIMGGALEGCTTLRSLEFSDKAVIGSIGAAALKGCTELRSLVLPPSLTSIGDEAFMGCSYLSNVIIPGSVKSVGARAFKNCTGFTNAQIEYGVESLGEEAFYGDWQISEVDIPSTVKCIGKNAFGGDSSIIRIGVRGDIRTIADIFSNYGLIREATVKEGTGAIVDGLFTNCTQLTDVRFFGNCPALVNNGANLYKGAKSSLKTYVSQDSTGWDGTPGSHQLPQAWPLTGSYRKSIAYWDVPSYLVEFDSNGGTLGVQSTYQYSERLFSLPPEPVQTGYSFAGWWTKPSGGLQVTADTVFIEGVYRRLYAHWVKGHWVFLDPNGGTVTNNFVTYIEQTVYGVLPAAVRTGYAFGGWRYKGQTVLPTMPISTAADHTLTAQWEAYKYSVKFNANGGEGEMNDLEMTYDEDRALPQNGFRRNGYAFLGWANDGTATGADYTDAESVRNLSSEENGVVELFAVWKKDGSNVTLDCIGDAEWAIDQSVVHDGAVAWRSGAIGDDQCSVLRTTVVGKGRVSFYWKVDCEWFRTLRLDSLAFSVDGQEIQWINGEKDWMHVEFDITDKGEHVLEWAYAKDSQDEDGGYEDCGWVSEVMWIPVLETLNDYLNCTNLVFETSGDAAWFGQREVSHDGFGALRSGSVGDNRRSCLSATINGPGVVSFWWKTDCEASYRTYILDHLAFYVDGEEKCFVNGDSGWKHKLVTVGAGQHTISWVYEKDEEGAEGEDCAWLDEVMCIPAGAFPEVVDNSEIVVALAGTADETKLATHITTKSEYDTFRSWVDSKGLSHDLVKDAPDAWLSYALDAPALMARNAPLASEDVVIESIEPSSAAAEAFDLVVDIAGAEIGEGATSARLADALGVEGAPELHESAFSYDGLTVSILRTSDGKVRATVMPDGAPPSFFLRVRVK